MRAPSHVGTTLKHQSAAILSYSVLRLPELFSPTGSFIALLPTIWQRPLCSAVSWMLISASYISIEVQFLERL